MSARESLGRGASALPIQHRVLVAVVVLQAAWLAALSSRGWFYQDDFTLLSQAVHQPMTLSYLRSPYNGHLAPGVRVMFWVLAHTSRLHYGPTIALRVVLQAVATVLLFRLLSLASQSRTIALVITMVYSLSPLLVPGTLYLGASAQLLPAQICVIVVYLAHIRHGITGKLRWSAVAGLAMLLGVSFWEKTAVTSFLLVILSLGWYSSGSLRHRVAGLIRDWRGWLLTLVPLAAFTAYYLTHNYASSARAIPARAGAHLIWLQWSHSLWPAVIGAPWHWASGGESYFAVAGTQPVAIVLGQCAFVALVIMGWRRTRWHGLLAWTIPIVAVAAGELLVGIGRYAEFGIIPAVGFSYAFDLAVPTALAIALAMRSPTVLAPVSLPSADAGAAAAGPIASRSWRRTRLVAGYACVLALLVSAVVSAVTFTNRWHVSPAKSYVSTLVNSIQQIGPTANLYDTPVSLRVLPFISPDRDLSHLLALTDAKVAFNVGTPQPEVVTDSGKVVPATFFTVAKQARLPNSFCPTLIKGVMNLTVPLTPKVGPNAYFLQIDYFEQRPALITITVKNRSGRVIPIGASSTVDFGQALGVVLLPLGQGRPAQVSFASSSEAASVCMSTVSIGEPVAAQP